MNGEKEMKKTISLALAFAMALSLTACGKGGGNAQLTQGTLTANRARISEYISTK